MMEYHFLGLADADRLMTAINALADQGWTLMGPVLPDEGGFYATLYRDTETEGEEG